MAPLVLYFRRYGVVLLAMGVLACDPVLPGPGTDMGQGQCSFPPLAGTLRDSVCRPPGGSNTCGEPLCGAEPDQLPPRIGRSFSVFDGDEELKGMCLASYGDDFYQKPLLDPAAQRERNYEHNELYSGCKRAKGKETISFWPVSPKECGSLAYFNGFMITPAVVFNDKDHDGVPSRDDGDYFKYPLGGNSHDGDQDFAAAPFGMGIQGADSDIPVDLRQVTSNSNLHIEVPWCRWYGAPITIPADALGHQEVNFCSFRPNSGERISVVGDWIVDGDETEIHEARFLVAVRPDRSGLDRCSQMDCMLSQADCLKDERPAKQPVTCADPSTPGCGNPNLWHLLASAHFAKDTAQQDELNITVPIPSSTNPSLDKLVYDIPRLEVTPGCRDGVMGVSVNCDAGSKTCSIGLYRNGGKMSDRSCGAEDVCPCTNRFDVTFGRCDKDWSKINLCDPNGSTHVAFAKDVRVEWKDPMDAWECYCDFEDPSKPGAFISAPVQGCVTHGFADDVDKDITRACEQVCGGQPRICQGSPACRIGAGRAKPAGTMGGQLLSTNACEEQPPADRVSNTGDLRVDLEPTASILHVGIVDDDGNLSEAATASVRGVVLASTEDGPQGRTLTLSDMRLVADDLTVALPALEPATFSNSFAVTLTRSAATRGADGTYVLGAGRIKLAIETSVNGARGTTVFLNQGPLLLTLDDMTGRFTVDGKGDDGKGIGVHLHLEGAVTNRPPVAVAGPDRTVECQAQGAATVVLDGRASSDPDSGDTLTHFQWFEGNTGLGNEPVASVQAALGSHTYSLHVYDTKLGSARSLTNVRVVDTTPPALEVTPMELCLWPPDHDFMLFRLGQELAVQASDTCDANPKVRILSVRSDESMDAPGSGNTSLDFIHGETAACVRAERSGPGDGRHYIVTVEARDALGNATMREVRVFVPHDMSAHHGCLIASGLDVHDERCSR